MRFHGLRHPAEMGGAEVEAFLTHLAAERGLAVSSHRQALSALLFLYGKVLDRQLPWMDEIGRPVPKRRLPVVLSADEVAVVLNGLGGVHGLLARLLYGTGLRIEEALELRVKDLDFANQAIMVRSGKGDKDRVVMLPRTFVNDGQEPRFSADGGLPGRHRCGAAAQLDIPPSKCTCAGLSTAETDASLMQWSVAAVDNPC